MRHRGRRPPARASRRALLLALLGEAFENLDAEFFCGRPLDLPELVPESDHFALLFDGHESPPKGFQKMMAHRNKMRTKSPAPSRDFPRPSS
ncbi:bsl4405 [Bradyrhizobium diazoefficiens USDA 110]|uniref:Bsl4405 protein n=1 Tax=Bradyrhizobium diazoefficiens (strain JCM 10833 / BCRC 13528 / IAM 13628 / NBRC 14792 / USDA 110) TaxID=224911 RepID=Q89LY8_BRADU|nr:hypothetical protein CO678_26350 [Bradyrhizobium diazoefficiens]QBP27177.1 hypothetical protein Bdiaspc4_22915 [Bradyrhizobium diazoefficiens]BAC49670.1 bsl4405 [Bradyrhizobium diazoefficiens USDA 110]